MKGLALSGLLFCILAAVLGAVATSGLGARTPSFSPLHVVQSDSRVQKIEPSAPVVMVHRTPAVDLRKTRSVVAPDVRVTSRRERAGDHFATRVQVKSASRVKAAHRVVPQAKPKPTLKPMSPTIATIASKARPKPARSPEAPAQAVASRPARPPQDASSDSWAARIKWQEDTLARWRALATDRDARLRENDDHPSPELEGTAAEGFYKADDQKSKKKKASKHKRHRFLFIRW